MANGGPFSGKKLPLMQGTLVTIVEGHRYVAKGNEKTKEVWLAYEPVC